MDDSEQCLNRLNEEMKAKVLGFIVRLRDCTRTQCDTNGQAIQKNISRISQDQARLQEARCGLESLTQENDPFLFIEVRRSSHFVLITKTTAERMPFCDLLVLKSKTYVDFI